MTKREIINWYDTQIDKLLQRAGELREGRERFKKKYASNCDDDEINGYFTFEIDEDTRKAIEEYSYYK